MLHAGNLPHGGGAFLKQLAESCWIAVARIVERCLGGYHPGWIESRRQSLKVDESANEQP
jgi:hypothetical protein